MKKRPSRPEQAEELELDYPPMEAQLTAALPETGNWQYEPKWDGFRCIAHKRGNQVDLISKNGQPLARYFPEVVASLQALSSNRFVLDGELVVPDGGRLSFDKLLQRIHPSASRIEKLARETPAGYIIFDMLVSQDNANITNLPLEKRRLELERFAELFLRGVRDIVMTPVSRSSSIARQWLSRPGSLTDGVIAKRLDLPYQSGNRKGMLKVKRKYTADCVIGGYRYSAGSPQIGSLLLGLYDDEGELHHVGFTSGLAAVDKQELTAKLEQLKQDLSFTINVPGAPSRWGNDRSKKWQPVKPVLVAEVQYDHLSNGRFRHGTKWLRWRPDKSPRQCNLDQLAWTSD